EVLPEHVLDVVLAAPLGRLAALQRLLGEAAVQLAELRVRLPRGESEPGTRSSDPCPLSGAVRVVGGQNETERPGAPVRIGVVLGQVPHVAEVNADRQRGRGRALPGLVYQRRRAVDRGDLGSRTRRAQRDRARAGAEVEPRLPRLDPEPFDELVVDGLEYCR